MQQPPPFMPPQQHGQQQPLPFMPPPLQGGYPQPPPPAGYAQPPPMGGMNAGMANAGAAAGSNIGPDGSTQSQRSVFIGNLPYDATEQQLKEFFSSVGPVVMLRMVNDKDTGRPKGFGFCEYRDAATAQSAIRNLNNSDFRGRAVRVDSSDQQGAGGQSSRLQREQQIALRQREEQAARNAATAANGGKDGAGGGGGDDDADNQRRDRMPRYTVGSTPLNPIITPIHMQKPHTIESISQTVRGMQRHQLIEILVEMKKFAASNPQGARQLLIDTPAVAQALLQIQMMFNLIRVEDLQRGHLARPQPQPQPQQRVPPLQPAATTAPSAAPAPAATTRPRAPVNLDTILAKLPPAEQAVLREVMKLSPEQLAKMPPHVQQQINGVRAQLAAG